MIKSTLKGVNIKNWFNFQLKKKIHDYTYHFCKTSIQILTN